MKRFILALMSAAALWSAACSGGGGIVPPPPPVGGYTLASLKGQYAFMTNGEVTSGSTPVSLARVGSFTADGTGKINGGVEDVSVSGAVTTATLIGNTSSYTMNADGRGTLTLVLPTASINFAITLTSTSGGLMIDETSSSSQASTGSGNFVKQNNAFFTVASVAGPYVFDFSGLDAAQGLAQAPESIVGKFAASNGPITVGVEDVNDSGQFTPAAAIAGNFGPDGANPATLPNFGRGIAVLNGVDYVYYIVDATRVRFLNITTGAMLSGDAVAQDNTVPTNVSSFNGGFAFLIAGSDSTGGPITRVGRFTATGAALSNVLEDSNDNGRFIQTDTASNASITRDAANPGRFIVTFTDPHFPSAPAIYIVYLSSATSGVLQETTVDSTKGAVDVADGTIAAQTGSPFSGTNIKGTYAFNWSGVSSQQGGKFIEEEDVLGEATIANLSLTGTDDIFQFSVGQPATNLASSGSIAIVSSDGTSADGKRNTMTVIYDKSSASASTVDFVVYFVNPQLAFFANTNASKTRVVAGILQKQN